MHPRGSGRLNHRGHRNAGQVRPCPASEYGMTIPAGRTFNLQLRRDDWVPTVFAVRWISPLDPRVLAAVLVLALHFHILTDSGHFPSRFGVGQVIVSVMLPTEAPLGTSRIVQVPHSGVVNS